MNLRKDHIETEENTLFFSRLDSCAPDQCRLSKRRSSELLPPQWLSFAWRGDAVARPSSAALLYTALCFLSFELLKNRGVKVVK